jgi:MoxR-like ATPase
MNEEIKQIIDGIGNIILGKGREVRLVITCLLAGGHLLIEDIPGMGKTTLAHAIARTMDLDYSRIQFTSDLLPADVVGVSVFNSEHKTFQFHKGPVFAQMVLADELNRATPRTQSALLEAMEERQVSVDGDTHRLPQPFFVIATQNQRHHVGTFPLPESQLDRFLMRIHLGYPDFQAERQLLTGQSRSDLLRQTQAVITVERLLQLQQEVREIYVSDAILDYIQDLLGKSRNNSQQYLGLSPRAGIALLQAAKAWALTEGRDMVMPEDVQAVAGSVLEHRLDPEGARIKGSEYRASRHLIQMVSINPSA